MSASWHIGETHQSVRYGAVDAFTDALLAHAPDLVYDGPSPDHLDEDAVGHWHPAGRAVVSKLGDSCGMTVTVEECAILARASALVPPAQRLAEPGFFEWAASHGGIFVT